MNENEIELKNNAIIHKDNSLNRLDLSFLKHIELNEYKKSDLLAYWINDFAQYHDEEKTFNIAKSGIYSRGDIIKVKVTKITDKGVNVSRKALLPKPIHKEEKKEHA